MDEQVLRELVENLAELESTGTDDRGAVTVTINGTGEILKFTVDRNKYRKLPVKIFEAAVVEAVSSARDAAADERTGPSRRAGVSSNARSAARPRTDRSGSSTARSVS